MISVMPPGRAGPLDWSVAEFPRHRLRLLRAAVQAYFVLVTLVIGVRFHHFVQHYLDPARPFVERPAAVDAFLPIGGFMAAKYFLFTGIVDPIHPAGFVLFVTIVAVSLLLKKGFCGWICPIGTLSELLWRTGRRVLGENLRMNPNVDVVLRSLKYVLLALFVLLIGVAMVPNMMVLFMITDYYKTADVRTMQFFTRMSTLAFSVVAGLVVLSLLYRNFWCRYLCPYGALLGLASRLSPVKVRRDETHCAHCRACSRHCPSQIDVEKETLVDSAECFGCLTCVSRCPQKGALDLTVAARGGRRILRPVLMPVLLVALFYLGVGLGMATGHWKSKVPAEEYARIIPTLYGREAPPAVPPPPAPRSAE